MHFTELDLVASAVSSPGAGLERLHGDLFTGRPTLCSSHFGAARSEEVQAHLGRIRVMMATANGDSTVISKIGIDPLSVGTGTIAAVGNNSYYEAMRRIDLLVTTPSTSAVAGVYSGSNQVYRGDAAGRGGFHFICRFGCATGQAATTRGFCGLTSLTSAPTDVDPSTLTNVLGMGWDTADSSIQIMHRTGSGTTAKEDLSSGWPVPSADRSKVFEFELYCLPNSSTVHWRLTLMGSGFTFGSLTTDLPAASTFLSPRCFMSVAGVSSVIGISFMNLYIQTD